MAKTEVGFVVGGSVFRSDGAVGTHLLVGAPNTAFAELGPPTHIAISVGVGRSPSGEARPDEFAAMVATFAERALARGSRRVRGREGSSSPKCRVCVLQLFA